MPHIDINVFYFAEGDFWNVVANERDGRELPDYSDTFGDKTQAINDATSLATMLCSQGAERAVVFVEGNELLLVGN